MLLLSALPVADTMLHCEKEVLPGPRPCNFNTRLRKSGSIILYTNQALFRIYCATKR